MYQKKIQGGEAMDKTELKYEMDKFGDNQSTLANAMGLSRTRLNYKINEKYGLMQIFTKKSVLFAEI